MDTPLGPDYHVGNALLPPGEAEQPDGRLLDAELRAAGAGSPMFTLAGNRPIYFRNRTYVAARHALVREMVRADEARYGRYYDETHQYVGRNTSKASWVARRRAKYGTQSLPEKLPEDWWEHDYFTKD